MEDDRQREMDILQLECIVDTLESAQIKQLLMIVDKLKEMDE